MNRYIYGIVAVAALLCLLPAQSSATPTVRWSRPYIKRMLIPGQAGAETVTFTADSRLSKVTVTAVQTLQPFLKVSPSYFKSISAGQSYSVTLTSTIPSNEPVGTLINGTVHLQAGTMTIAQPLAVVLDVEAASSRNPDPQSIVQDGLVSYPVNEIVVTFSAGSSLNTAQAFALTIRGTVVGALTEIDTYQIIINTTTISELTALIAQLRASPPTGVVGISRNYISVAPSSAPTDLENLKTCPHGPTETAAYDTVRITGAWQIARLENPVGIPRNTVIGLLDTGVQVVIGTTPLGQVFHPESSAPPVNFGNTPPESLADTEFVAGQQGHGTEVAGIVGANNRSDPSLGLDYQCPAMNGIISGVPNISGRYTLEERVGPSATITTQLANTVSATTSGARIVLLEIESTATARLTADQLNTGAACKFAAVNDILDLEINYVRWSNLFKVHSDVLFVLPAGNYDQQLPQLTSASQFADVVSLVGGINRDNTITVAAFDPMQPDTNPNYRAVWGVTPSGVTCSASNFGPGVDIAAPGSHVFAPKPTDLTHLGANDFYIDSFQGTSASAPFVAGAAALLYAIDPALPIEPSKVPLHLKTALITTADPLFPAFGIGNRLNVCRAAKTTLGAQFQLPSANPNNSAVNVAVNISGILLNFSLPVDANTLPTSFLISGSGQPVTGSLQISDDKRSILFVLSQGLQSGTVYHVDLSTIKDVCGDSLPAGTTYAFTTVAPVVAPPDLTISKTANSSAVTSGGALTYTITAQNAAGTADALNVTVTDPLPTGVSFTSCSVSTGGCSALNGTVTALFGTLAGGVGATLTVSTNAPSVTSSTTITNTATVSTSTPESNTANNQASATTVINLPVATFVQLTNTISRVVQQQVLSRDGLKLAFISTADLTGQNPLGREALFVINSDGTGTRQLAVSPLDYDPNRSPSFGGPSLSGDGSKVAFTLLTASFGSDLWIINSDGTGAGRLATSSASFLGFPSISSDGTKIAFFIQNRIEIINSDGTGNFSLAFVSVATPPFISGDGSKVFFVASSEIFRVNADGTSLFQVTHLSQVGLFVFPGSLSVDYLGQKVTFITGGTAVLSVINSDGTGFLQLGVLGANLSSASISDDGRKIAFSSPFKVGDGFGPEQIYLIDVNGGNLRQITSVTSFGCFRPKLDATGTRVSFLSSADLTGQNADNSPELFLANVTPP